MINLFLLWPLANKTTTIDDIVIHHNDVHGSASKKQSKATSYQALEHLYLVMQLAEDYKLLGLTDKDYLATRLIIECSRLMVSRTEKLDQSTQFQVFLACNHLFEKNGISAGQFSGRERLTADAILNKDFSAWKLAAKIH